MDTFDEREQARLRANAMRQREEAAASALYGAVDAAQRRRLAQMDSNPTLVARNDLLLLVRFADAGTLQIAVDRLADLIAEVRRRASDAQARQRSDSTRWMNW